MRVEEQVSLAEWTTLGIGGPARWMLTAESEADVAEAVAFARGRDVPLFVLGGGSNLLVADAGFAGVVLRMAIRGVSFEDADEGEHTLVRTGAGDSWDALVQQTVDRDLAGMECLAGIPGTVGGTPVQNVGAYGQEVAETIVSVRCFDLHTSTTVALSNTECGFGYRTSRLNTTERGRYVVTGVTFGLQRGGAPKLTYADLKKRLGEGAKPSLRETADVVRAIRREKSMVIDAGDVNSRSAGSFFRNPVTDANSLLHAAEAAGVSVDAVPHWPVDGGRVKLPAAWLLERAGFIRGYAMGNAGISTRHTLALVNRGGAAAADIVTLRDRIVAEVRLRFGVELEQEPVSLGF